jgi:hypothetical protein
MGQLAPSPRIAPTAECAVVTRVVRSAMFQRNYVLSRQVFPRRTLGTSCSKWDGSPSAILASFPVGFLVASALKSSFVSGATLPTRWYGCRTGRLDAWTRKAHYLLVAATSAFCVSRFFRRRSSFHELSGSDLGVSTGVALSSTS